MREKLKKIGLTQTQNMSWRIEALVWKILECGMDELGPVPVNTGPFLRGLFLLG